MPLASGGLTFFWPYTSDSVHFLRSTLSIEHGFGIIPAPRSPARGMQKPHFAFPQRRPGYKKRTSAFPVPPSKSSETPMKISCVPPRWGGQTLALGAVSARSEVPQLQG